MLYRADQSITRQLDLMRYIKLQRFQWLSVLLLLKRPQWKLIDKVSSMHIRESSDLSRGSVEEFSNSNTQDPPIMQSEQRRLVELILKSKDPVDVRLTSLTSLKKVESLNEQNEEQQEVMVQSQAETCIAADSKPPREAYNQIFERVTKRKKQIILPADQEAQVILEEQKQMEESHNYPMNAKANDSMAAPLTLPSISRADISECLFDHEVLP